MAVVCQVFPMDLLVSAVLLLWPWQVDHRSLFLQRLLDCQPDHRVEHRRQISTPLLLASAAPLQTVHLDLEVCRPVHLLASAPQALVHLDD